VRRDLRRDESERKKERESEKGKAGRQAKQIAANKLVDAPAKVRNTFLHTPPLMSIPAVWHTGSSRVPTKWDGLLLWRCIKVSCN